MTKSDLPSKLDIITISNQFDFIIVDNGNESMHYHRTAADIKRAYATASPKDREQIKSFLLANRHMYHLVGFFLVTWSDMPPLTNRSNEHTHCGLSLDQVKGVTVATMAEALGLSDTEYPKGKSYPIPPQRPLPPVLPKLRPHSIKIPPATSVQEFPPLTEDITRSRLPPIVSLPQPKSKPVSHIKPLGKPSSKGPILGYKK